MSTTGPGYFRLLETHSAGLVLVGDLALKFKKPVDLGFLDFTDARVRRETCRREVDLNRRFSPDVYLGVGDVELPAGACGPAPTHEPVVVMRRMPEECRLSRLVGQGTDVSDALRRLAHLLAAAHGASRWGPEIDEEAGAGRLRERWAANVLTARQHAGRVVDAEVVDTVEDLGRRFLDGREPLLARRVLEGCAVDGHGDLLADDVFCLADGPRVLDCLEFDDRLRFVDRLDDAAFLAMDLERLGRPDLAASFLRHYADLAADPAPPSLMHHYIAYRAFVRAKVSCLRADQGDREAGGLARRLADMSQAHLRTGAVFLALVGGPPGSGKSTLAGALADRLGLVVLSSDRVRKELAGLSPEAPAPSAFGTGLYDAEHTRATYAELLRRSRLLLGLGESVVLDASWSEADRREDARRLADAAHADLWELACRAPADLRRTRLESRRARGPSTSDADAVVAARLSADAAPWPQAAPVHTEGATDETVRTVVALVRPVEAAAMHHRRRPLMAPD